VPSKLLLNNPLEPGGRSDDSGVVMELLELNGENGDVTGDVFTGDGDELGLLFPAFWLVINIPIPLIGLEMGDEEESSKLDEAVKSMFPPLLVRCKKLLGELIGDEETMV